MWHIGGVTNSFFGPKIFLRHTIYSRTQKVLSDPKFIFRPKNLASFDLYSSLSDCRREYNFSWLSVWWCLVFQLNCVRCPHPNCSQSTKYLRCPPSNFMFSPQPNCSLHQESMCGAPTPQCSSLLLPHSALSWILSKVENLASSSLLPEAQIGYF